jgi:TolA-binding protein
MTLKTFFSCPYVVATFLGALFYLALLFTSGAQSPSDTEQRLMKENATQAAQIATLQQQLSDMEFTIDRRFGLLRDQAFLDRLEQGQGPAIIAKQLALLSSQPRIASR